MGIASSRKHGVHSPIVPRELHTRFLIPLKRIWCFYSCSMQDNIATQVPWVCKFPLFRSLSCNVRMYNPFQKYSLINQAPECVYLRIDVQWLTADLRLIITYFWYIISFCLTRPLHPAPLFTAYNCLPAPFALCSKIHQNRGRRFLFYISSVL